MKTFLSVVVIGCFVLVTDTSSEAQLPLGRDTPTVLKQESSGTVTVTGRYQIFVSPHVKGHTFMLDTETGRLWILKKDGMSGDFSMERIAVEQVDSQTSPKGTRTKSPPGDNEGRK
jgi:hypothetical protein